MLTALQDMSEKLDNKLNANKLFEDFDFLFSKDVEICITFLSSSNGHSVTFHCVIELCFGANFRDRLNLKHQTSR